MTPCTRIGSQTFPSSLLYYVQSILLRFIQPIHAITQHYVPLLQIDIGLLADNVGESATDTTNLGQSVHDLDLSINVGVEETQDVVEVLRRVGCNEGRHLGNVTK